MAQGQKTLHRIAFVPPGPEEGYKAYFNAFRSALKELGYVEERDVSIEVFWGDNKIENLAARAAAIVAHKPSIIVTAGSAPVAAFKKATSTIPIVFATAGNVVEQGFVASLRRPGGNITGVSLHTQLTAKVVEVAREALPRLRRFAMLLHDKDPISQSNLEDFEASARRFNLEPVVVRISRAEDLDQAFREMGDRKADALFVPTIGLLTANREKIIGLALKARLPHVSINPDTALAGGLLSYGTLLEENYRRAAGLVDKILRGAKPAELAVEQPERFQLIVNRKTAKAIGVEISRATLLLADRVID